ncbi:SGNH/GDSL hydrolase family protein [Kribbella speibonae]|uniref:SGNH/GDSL hydrolase family protein n=1 Tax=Kribbella speibonae TaxID=1572660 RepID=A0A4R0IJ23_9ACTN|nr:SGNH/GDSL hydrolase family protein [Kribbella speibonae]TCC32709.1 SGNH/GDSL hydrolase family protein [Kribbella speibonae]
MGRRRILDGRHLFHRPGRRAPGRVRPFRRHLRRPRALYHHAGREPARPVRRRRGAREGQRSAARDACPWQVPRSERPVPDQHRRTAPSARGRGAVRGRSQGRYLVPGRDLPRHPRVAVRRARVRVGLSLAREPARPPPARREPHQTGVIHTLRRLASGLLVLAFVSAVTGADTVGELLPSTPGQVRVVALGDSVTSGSNCDCAAFPQLYGDLLHNRSAVPVTVDNQGVAGLDSTGLLQQLSQRDVERSTKAANVVLLTIGANDFGDHHDDVTSGQCSGDCVSDEYEQLTANLGRILSRIHALRGDRPTTILMTGYWNVFKDGAVAEQQYTPSGRIASDQLTVRTNNAIAAAASADDATYVDIYTPFEDSADITALLASDGDHPNAAGHALIARLLLAATPNPLPTSPRQGG